MSSQSAPKPESHENCQRTQAATTGPGNAVALAAFPKEDLTLDPDTAPPLLEILVDGKEVRCRNFTKSVSAGPRRFDTANCVVAKESFREGQRYWEVFVGWKPRWNLGIVSDQAKRQGRLIQKSGSGEVCPKGYWMIGFNEKKAGKQHWAFDTHLMPIECSPHPETIGVLLNYPRREVTFYNADDPSNLIPLYTFYNANFNNTPIYPFFNPCFHDYGSNEQPLKIL